MQQFLSSNLPLLPNNCGKFLAQQGKQMALATFAICLARLSSPMGLFIIYVMIRGDQPNTTVICESSVEIDPSTLIKPLTQLRRP